jgi:hypothetical protein
MSSFQNVYFMMFMSKTILSIHCNSVSCDLHLIEGRGVLNFLEWTQYSICKPYYD